MRLDEDVGKVAAVAPVLISRAVELFLAQLVAETCSRTRARDAKRLTSAHLKETIEAEAKFDFLIDIAEKIPAQSTAAEPKEKRKRVARADKVLPGQPVVSEDDDEEDEEVKQETV
ncbi:MAG: hypothetical protein SGCHY_000405 [Lobulomycetales sp.]